MNLNRHPDKKIFYGWWIIIAGTIINALNGGVFFYGFSIFFMPLVDEFGWSRAAVSLGVSLSRLERGILAPLIGFLIDRIGPRRLMLFGVSLTGIGYFLFGQINSFGMYLLVFLGCMSIGQGFSTYGPVHTAAANWFIKKRSQVMGILQAGLGAGGILVPVFAMVITRYGWRAGAVAGGATFLVMGLPLAALFRHRPEQYGYLPDGEPARVIETPVTTSAEAKADRLPPGELDFSTKEAMKTMAFWLLAIGFGLAQAVSVAVILHSVPYLTGVGISTVAAAAITGAIGMGSIFSRLLFGWLGDRFSKKYLLAVTFALEGVGVLILSGVQSTWHTIPFLIVFCLGYGGMQPVILAILGDYFGRKNYGAIFGFQQFFWSLPQMGLPVLAGWVFDVTGNYWLAFLLFVILLAVVTGLILTMRPPVKAGLSKS